MRILVYPSGSEVSLEIHAALSWDKHISLLGCDSSPQNKGDLVFKVNHKPLPKMSDPAFMDEIWRLVELEGVDYVYPGNDDATVYLTPLGDRLLIPSKETARICRSKRKTYGELSTTIRTPTCDGRMDFPVFLKPDQGSGSKDCHIIRSARDLQYYYTEGSFIMEYIPGDEYTVDCFSDEGLKFAGPRRRSSVSGGISIGTELVFGEIGDALRDMAEKIDKKLGMRGAWFFQARGEGTNLCLQEVSVRIAGSSGIHRYNGMNLPLMHVNLYAGNPVSFIYNPIFRNYSRPLSGYPRWSPAYDHVYVDVNDTLIVDGLVNPLLMQFLYQTHNNGRKIHLISTYDGDLITLLKKYRLPDIFSGVIHLPPGSRKSTGITNFPCIFIDDSFRERMEVHRDLQIPTFDLCSVGGLLDTQR